MQNIRAAISKHKGRGRGLPRPLCFAHVLSRPKFARKVFKLKKMGGEKHCKT